MKSKILGCSFLLLILLLKSTISLSQQFLKADGKKIVNENGEEIILRGMGMGGWMLQEGYMLQVSSVANPQHQIRAKIQDLIGEDNTNTFYEAWLTNYCKKADIDSLASWGFNSVRLPIHYNLFTLPIEKEPVAGKQTWLEKGFVMTDSLIKWCKANQIYLILDLHAAPGGQGHDAAISDYDTSKPSLWESEANKQKTIALWKKLAERYANEPTIGAYDIINEPNWGFENVEDKNGCSESKNEPLKKLLKDITTAIREVDNKHIVIIEGNCWGNNYSGIAPDWDNNLVLSFHKYWNYNDKNSLQGILNLRDQYNIPIWLGESGENSNTWFTNAIQLVEDNEIGWAWWTYKKLGLNTPLEVNVNAGYQKVLDYWNGKATQPTSAEAYDAFMQLADNLKIENCTYHQDIIDAMFRQVRSYEALPFKQHKIISGTRIYAVDYDLGRNGVAYFDKDTANYRVVTNVYTNWNQGWAYRNDGVDIETCKDSQTNGYNVGWIEKDEWLQYTVEVEKAGNYDLKVRIAADNNLGKINILSNSIPLAETISIPNTGGTQKWESVEVQDVYLTKGKNIIRVKMVNGGFNLNYIEFYRT